MTRRPFLTALLATSLFCGAVAEAWADVSFSPSFSISVSFATAGVFTWKVPPGRSVIWVDMCAGGAGGESGQITSGAGGGGGGSGAVLKNFPVAVTPLSTLTLTVGAAGLGGIVASTVAGNGGTTSISGTVDTVQALTGGFAGGKGAAGTGGAAGLGGTPGQGAPAALGDIWYQGGNNGGIGGATAGAAAQGTGNGPWGGTNAGAGNGAGGGGGRSAFGAGGIGGGGTTPSIGLAPSGGNCGGGGGGGLTFNGGPGAPGIIRIRA